MTSIGTSTGMWFLHWTNPSWPELALTVMFWWNYSLLTHLVHRLINLTPVNSCFFSTAFDSVSKASMQKVWIQFTAVALRWQSITAKYIYILLVEFQLLESQLPCSKIGRISSAFCLPKKSQTSCFAMLWLNVILWNVVS